MRSGNAAVCAAGREGNYIWSASRMDIWGGGGKYPASFRTSETTRAVETRVSERGVARAIRVQCATTTSMRGEHRRGDDRVNPGDAPSPRCPLVAGNGTKGGTKPKPQHPTPAAVPAQKVVRRGRAGNARLHRPHGPCTRPKDPVDKIRRRAREIRDRTRWTRANIDVACRARLPGFQGKNRGECDRRVGRRTGVNIRASSPVWPVGSSTFARVLACRLKGVSRRVDWRAAVNRVLEARKEVAFELGREET